MAESSTEDLDIAKIRVLSGTLAEALELPPQPPSKPAPKRRATRRASVWIGTLAAAVLITLAAAGTIALVESYSKVAKLFPSHVTGPVRAATCQGAPAFIRPKSMFISCDSSVYLEHMQWSAWTFSYAEGTGILHLDNCNPSCAAGAFHDYTVAVRFDHPVLSRIGLVWNRAIFRFPQQKPYGQERSVFDDLASSFRQ